MKIGILGLGFMGAVHLDAYAKLPDVQVAAVCSQNERALAGDLGSGGNLDRSSGKYDFLGASKYTHWRELVLDPQLDAVDICLPTDLHPAVAIAALTAGKHVLCEKPMALTAADCERMLSTAVQQNRMLMIGQVLRFWPEYVYLQKFIKSGELGAVQAAVFTRYTGLPDWSRWLTVEARSGGAALDLLVHDIDQILLLFGMPERIAAKSMGDVDALTAKLSYANGLEIQLDGGWMLPGAPLAMGFRIKTESAELEFDSNGLVLRRGQLGSQMVETAKADAYQAEIAYFVDCCLNGKTPDRCLPKESAEAVKLAWLLKQSRANGGEGLKCSV